MIERGNTEGETDLKINEEDLLNLPLEEESPCQNQQHQYEYVVDHKAEALKGNFMPSTLMVERKLFKINDPINSNGDTLLHLAVQFLYMNVIKTLIELFEANINVTNNEGKTPLQIICANKKKDPLILSYFIKNDNIDVNVSDKEGITPLVESIKNNYNYAFLAFVYLKCKLDYKDNQGNDLYYYAFKSDNKFVLKFLLQHGPKLAKSLNIKTTLSELLIGVNGTKCTRYLMKYRNSWLSNDSLFASTQDLSQFPKYNKVNYELIKTTYNYKQFSSFKALISIIIEQYELKMFNLYFLVINLMMVNTPMLLKRLAVIIYSFFMCTMFASFYFVHNHDITLSFRFLFDSYQLSTYLFFLVAFIKLFLMSPDFNSYECRYYLSNKETEKDNVTYTIHQALERSVFDLPNEDEICSSCLIKKPKSSNHCNRCDKCVKDFYFHSVHLDTCINGGNVGYYFTYVSCLWFIHFSIIAQFYNYINSVNGNTLYASEYFFANGYEFMLHLTSLQFIFIMYLLTSGIILFGHSMSVLICKGSQVPSYLMFRYHKIPSDKLRLRGKEYLSIADINLIAFKDFIFNLLCGKARTHRN